MTLFIIYLISTVCGVKPSNLLPSHAPSVRMVTDVSARLTDLS